MRPRFSSRLSVILAEVDASYIVSIEGIRIEPGLSWVRHSFRAFKREHTSVQVDLHMHTPHTTTIVFITYTQSMTALVILDIRPQIRFLRIM
jgi:predicted transcriptional regulator